MGQLPGFYLNAVNSGHTGLFRNLVYGGPHLQEVVMLDGDPAYVARVMKLFRLGRYLSSMFQQTRHIDVRKVIDGAKT